MASDNCSENATEYLWDDGNGNHYTNFEPVFTYQEAGEYRVTMIAYSDNREEQNRVTVTIGDQTEVITNYYPNGIAACDMRGCANFTLPVGTYLFHAQSGSVKWNNIREIKQDKCTKELLC